MRKKIDVQSALRLKRIHDAWPKLNRNQRRWLAARALWFSIPQVPRPVKFGALASLAMFALLLVMPLHIMAIPAAFGGGLALALIVWR